MRKSLEQGHVATTGTGDSSFASSGFGHPLDMLARTAANTHSPEERFTPVANTFTPPSQAVIRGPTTKVNPSDAITTTWSSDISGIDPVERGWIDLEDAKRNFER
jgi:hypothetical protein